MPIYQVTLCREATIIERVKVVVEANTSSEAETLALGKDGLSWEETDVGEADIGASKVESVEVVAQGDENVPEDAI